MPADLCAKEELNRSQSAKRLLGAVFALSSYICLSGSAWALEVIVFAGGFNWPIWAAQQQGYFTNNGVQVHLTLTPGSEYQLKGLIEGNFDLAMTAIDNVIAYDEGQGEASVSVKPDLVVVMGGDNGFLRLVTIPEVTSYAALKGKALTVDARTTGYAFVLAENATARRPGDDEYELVKVGGVLARFDDLMQRNHAGTLLLSPFEVAAEAKGFHVLGSAVDAFDGHYQGLVAATRREWAKEHGANLSATSAAISLGLLGFTIRATRTRRSPFCANICRKCLRSSRPSLTISCSISNRALTARRRSTLRACVEFWLCAANTVSQGSYSTIR